MQREYVPDKYCWLNDWKVNSLRYKIKCNLVLMKLIARGVNVQAKVYTFVGFIQLEEKKWNVTCFCKRELIVCQFSSVQSLSHVQLFVTPWNAECQAFLSIANSWSLPKLMCIESVMPSSHLILCRPLLLLPPIPPSIRVFSNESTLHMRWPKYWSFSFSISPSKGHPGLISFRMDWLDLLAVQGTLKSLLQHHSSKASILQCSAFFTVQLSHPYMTIGKTIALTRRTFVGKVMSLLLNMLSRLVITSLPRSLGFKRHLNSFRTPETHPCITVTGLITLQSSQRLVVSTLVGQSSVIHAAAQIMWWS